MHFAKCKNALFALMLQQKLMDHIVRRFNETTVSMYLKSYTS